MLARLLRAGRKYVSLFFILCVTIDSFLSSKFFYFRSKISLVIMNKCIS